jgi:hypothetical protein
VVGAGFFKSEVERVRALPRDIANELYLALLAATLLLTVGWSLVSHKELSILCEWLDPKDYQPPDESLVGFGIAAALSVLFFASRSPLWFGISYSVYAAINLAAVIHLKNQMVTATHGSRQRLEDEPPEGAQLYQEAIDLLDLHYVKRPNVLRVATILVLAVTGLTLSILSKDGVHPRLNTYAYLVYLTSLVVLEGLVMFVWRAKLYSGVKPLAVARYELERARTSRAN